MCLSLSFNTPHSCSVIWRLQVIWAYHKLWTSSDNGKVWGYAGSKTFFQEGSGPERECPLCSANIVSSWGNITVILWLIIINIIWFFPIPGTELLKLFQLPKWWKQWGCLLLFITSPFNHIGVYVNEVAVGKLLGNRRMGAGCQWSRPTMWLEGWNIQSHS